MTGASIVRWGEGEELVLSVHGAFDGASAWALRVEMDASPERSFVVDLTYAVEACEFAANVLANWQRERARDKRLRVRPGAPEHVALLEAFGLEVEAPDERPALVRMVDVDGPPGVEVEVEGAVA